MAACLWLACSASAAEPARQAKKKADGNDKLFARIMADEDDFFKQRASAGPAFSAEEHAAALAFLRNDAPKRGAKGPAKKARKEALQNSGKAALDGLKDAPADATKPSETGKAAAKRRTAARRASRRASAETVIGMGIVSPSEPGVTF